MAGFDNGGDGCQCFLLGERLTPRVGARLLCSPHGDKEAVIKVRTSFFTVDTLKFQASRAFAAPLSL